MKKPKRRKPGQAKRKPAPPSVAPVARPAPRRRSAGARAVGRPQISPTLLLPFLILATIYAAQPPLNAGIAALTRWLAADEPRVVAIRPEPRSRVLPAIHAPIAPSRSTVAALDTTEPDQTAAIIARRPPIAAPPTGSKPAMVAGAPPADPEHAQDTLAARAPLPIARSTTPADPEHALDILAARVPLSVVATAPLLRTLPPQPRDPEQANSLLAARPPAPARIAEPSAPAPVDPEQIAALIPSGRPAPVRAPEPAPYCQPGSHPFAVRASAPAVIASADDPAFGLKLARAALGQTREMVIYNARYFSLAYPLGDVPPLFGVCTDVVVRAYRALGIDLQPLVHRSRASRGDRHIDHRRVEVLRRFLELHAERLPITDFAETFRPGDIVTYHRPEGRSSTAHIAIVAEAVAPSGRPMIIHNRGWGPQLEDALFADRITGHFRYRGPGTLQARAAPPPQATSVAAGPRAPMAGIE